MTEWSERSRITVVLLLTGAAGGWLFAQGHIRSPWWLILLGVVAGVSPRVADEISAGRWTRPGAVRRFRKRIRIRKRINGGR